MKRSKQSNDKRRTRELIELAIRRQAREFLQEKWYRQRNQRGFRGLAALKTRRALPGARLICCFSEKPRHSLIKGARHATKALLTREWISSMPRLPP